MDPGKLADLAAGVFGPDRVRVADRLDDAIELAVALADEAAADRPGRHRRAGDRVGGDRRGRAVAARRGRRRAGVTGAAAGRS